MADADAIREYFAPFLELNHERYDDVIRDLNGAVQALDDKAMGKIDDVGNDLSDWRGSAADSFNEERLSTFKPIVDHQRKLINELALAAGANKKIAEEAQKDIITIVMGLEAGLEALDADGCGCSKDELTKILGIVGAVTAAIGLGGAILGVVSGAAAVSASVAATAGAAGARIGTGGASLGLLSAAGGAANNFRSSPDKIALKGETVDELLESAKKAIEALNKGIDDQEKKVKTTLGEDADILKEADMQVADIELSKDNFAPPP